MSSFRNQQSNCAERYNLEMFFGPES